VHLLDRPDGVAGDPQATRHRRHGAACQRPGGGGRDIALVGPDGVRTLLSRTPFRAPPASTTSPPTEPGVSMSARSPSGSSAARRRSPATFT
jgi:hypothetical protein